MEIELSPESFLHTTTDSSDMVAAMMYTSFLFSLYIYFIHVTEADMMVDIHYRKSHISEVECQKKSSQALRSGIE